MRLKIIRSKSSLGNFWGIHNVRISFKANTVSTISIFRREKEILANIRIADDNKCSMPFFFSPNTSSFPYPSITTDTANSSCTQLCIHDIRHILFLAPSSLPRFSANRSIEQNDSLRSVATYFDPAFRVQKGLSSLLVVEIGGNLCFSTEWRLIIIMASLTI